jgi:hypothetical protein
MSSPSQATTVLSDGINVRQASSDCGCPNLPKLVASNSDIAGQSASVAGRMVTAFDVSEASTEIDGATKPYPNAFDLTSVTSGTEGARVMATDLTLYLDDQPGELARVGDALGKAGTNIVGLCALTTGGGQAEVHILVQDATSAFEALHDAGIKIVAEQEVIVLDVEDRPGALGDVAHKLGKARVNLTTAYLATNTRLVLAADNLAEAKAALS